MSDHAHPNGMRIIKQKRRLRYRQGLVQIQFHRIHLNRNHNKGNDHVF